MGGAGLIAVVCTSLSRSVISDMSNNTQAHYTSLVVSNVVVSKLVHRC